MRETMESENAITPWRPFRVTAAGFSVYAPRLRGGTTVDLLINGRRVWTFHARPKFGVLSQPWPAGLAPRMIGSGTIALAVRGRRPFASAQVELGGQSVLIDITDEDGRDQVVNKWGDLTTTFDAADPALPIAILTLARRLVDVLEPAGYDVMITSGTLLGWVRRKGLLPHDDDADLAVVVTESQSPADIAITGYALRSLLIRNGFSVMLHSAAHLQVHVEDEAVDGSAYCDIFLGFYRGEEYCQPFHLRQEVPLSSLLPTQHVEIEGVGFPAPPVPSDWLAACYGPGWETPDPAFTFNTPASTRDRYEHWFGTFNFGRDFWDSHYASRRAAPATVVDHVRAVQAVARTQGLTDVLDAACGDGSGSIVIAGGLRLRAFDFCDRALERARTRLPDGAEVVKANLADPRDLVELEVDATRRPAVVSMHDVLHTLTRDTRRNALRLVRTALRAGGAAIASFPSEQHESFEFRAPNTWHLPTDQLDEEAAQVGLSFTVLKTSQLTNSARARTTVQFVLRDEPRG